MLEAFRIRRRDKDSASFATIGGIKAFAQLNRGKGKSGRGRSCGGQWGENRSGCGYGKRGGQGDGDVVVRSVKT